MTEYDAHDLTEQQRQWLLHIRACEASGHSMKVYASEHSIDIKALYSWKKALVKKGVLPRTRPTCFQRVQVSVPASSCEWRIQLPNGVTVALSGATDEQTLRGILTAAAAIV